MNSTTTPTPNGNGSLTANDSGYPLFQPNQVLSNKDLNRIVSYLDRQNHLTRTHTIGLGIVCGLTVEKPVPVEKPGSVYTISIAEGCGITSAGYFIHYQQVGKPEDDTFTHFRVIELEHQKFGLTKKPQDLVQVRELVTATTVTAEQQKEEDFSPLTKTDLEKRVIAVLYDWEDLPRDSCLLDCDDKGLDRNFRLRFLLLDREPVEEVVTPPWLDATTLLKEGYKIPADKDLSAYFQGWYEMPDTIKRLGYQSTDESSDGKERIDLSEIKSLAEFKKAYQKICGLAIGSEESSIPNVFSQIHTMFGPFLGGWKPDEEDFDKNRLTQYLNSFLDDSPTSPYRIQYFYDYLVDLIAAYQELKDLLFDLMADCMPDLGRFPKYLLLGEVPVQQPETCAPPSLYRHHFTQPPIYNGNAKRVQEAHHLYKRLLKMSQGFVWPSSSEIKVTPSRSRLAPLGEQAIPYYYSYDALSPYWNYDACRQGRSEQLPAYDRPGTHLTDLLDWSDFFRIEGHVGKSLKEAMKTIEDYRQQFNLAFDLVAVRLSAGASLGDYAKEYSGLEHLGGVPKGGTFVLVYTSFSNGTDQVIGDFCLPCCYRPPVMPADNCFQKACLTICQGFKNREKMFTVKEIRAGKTYIWDDCGIAQMEID